MVAIVKKLIEERLFGVQTFWILKGVRCRVAVGAVLQVTWGCKRYGVASGAALQLVQHCKWCSIVSGAALQAVWHYSRCGIAGSDVSYVVQRVVMQAVQHCRQ